jgi:hypothetical protein
MLSTEFAILLPVTEFFFLFLNAEYEFYFIAEVALARFSLLLTVDIYLI